ncbi:MAG: MoaD/ThiS family protein [Ignavibacteria bacterium]|nr:MoaD/ThiS family protein [Ignavibacteria bacterium]
MSIQVKFFGLLTEIVGADEISVNGIADTDELKTKLLRDFPKLKDNRFVIAVSKQIIRNNQALHAGDVVALLPPFAGG